MLGRKDRQSKCKAKLASGAWAAQSAEQPTLGFSSGHDLRVMRLIPVLGLGFSHLLFAGTSFLPCFHCLL